MEHSTLVQGGLHYTWMIESIAAGSCCHLKHAQQKQDTSPAYKQRGAPLYPSTGHMHVPHLQ